MADDYLNIGGNKIKLVDLGDGSYGFAADCPDLETLTGALNAAAVTDPTASASVTALLKGIIKQLQGGGAGSLPAEVSTIRGTATDGTETMVIDSTKDFEADVLIGKVVKITIDGVDYFRRITGSVANSFIFPAILDPVAASAVIGSGQDAEGQVTIRCQGDLDGEAGNAYSVEIVQGVDTTGDTIASLEGTVLTITVNLDGLGDPRLLAAGDMQNLIANTVGVSDKFIVDAVFVAGNIPIGGAAIPFTLGADGISVVAGTQYEIAVAEKNVTTTVTGSQPVEVTGRNIAVSVIDASSDAAIAAGSSETITVTPPTGKKYKIIGFSASVTAPGGTTGTHYIAMFIPHTTLDVSIGIITTTYSSNLIFSNQAGTGVTSSPSDLADFLTKLFAVSFDNDTPLKIYYKNSSDVTQTNKRKIVLLVEEEGVV
ncbi:hypothetical protein [Phosphitispora fastidiosa]|uniref:hypothetical protein n=1 Tax=Phosphitispora fastidiosa TaxID=2837202 RepID=UPI001E35DABC|nr:hypothetical protein [Phosphitispora fastidiosa]MBU7006305.1 hypothetical protein [Phosphitispora fastidiosa]